MCRMLCNLQAKYAKLFKLDEAEFEVVCGGRSPSFVVSVAKKKPTAQMESDSDVNNVSSEDNDEDRAIREAKEADKRQKIEQRAEARKEKKIQKETGMFLPFAPGLRFPGNGGHMPIKAQWVYPPRITCPKLNPISVFCSNNIDMFYCEFANFRIFTWCG